MLVLGICFSLGMSGYHRATRLLGVLLRLLSGLLPLVPVHHAPLKSLDPAHQSVLIQSEEAIVVTLYRRNLIKPHVVGMRTKQFPVQWMYW